MVPRDEPTIHDVARRVGVSVATVSRAMNGRDGVAPATIERVRQAVAELGYETSLVARSLRRERTDVIGVLMPRIEPFTAELLKGAAPVFDRSPFELVVYAGGTNGRPGWERRYLSRVGGTLTDGIVLVTPTVIEIDVDYPVVAVDPHVGGDGVPTVAAENFEGAVSAVRHLVELGHDRIGFLAGRDDLLSAQRREAGYCAAMADAGLDVAPELIARGDFTEAAAARAAERLLDLAERPSAIFAANDVSALAVLRAAADRGLRVPEDLSVVGFDNIPESALAEPPLTTVDQAIQEQGRVAVELLVGLIGGDSAPSTPTTLPTRLVVRHSTGPATTGRTP